MTALWEQVGNTKLLYLKSLSERTGCRLWAKAEFENPGGSIKDRAAKQIILEAEGNGQIKPGDTIVEGTAGNTGIGLATLGIPRGYKVVITMPNNQSREKVATLQSLGAEVLQFPPCPFADQNHFYHQAGRYAEKNPGVFWANQFENLANFKAHFEITGPEIFQQTKGDIDHFIGSVGTGGTMGGVSCYLKKMKPAVQIVVADPFGSGVLDYLQHGQFKNEGASITEGIGIMRLTENFKRAQVDRALRISDQEMINMLYYLKEVEHLVVGSSSALNVMAAVKVALENRGSGQTLVTMLCDHGDRYRSKIFNDQWLLEKKLLPQTVEI
jgi:cysteine synthase A